MQSTHHKVAGFRGGHADFDSFTVAHFTDENDLRRLAQRGAQAGGECAEVVSHFPLIERRLLLRVHELDRVFECHDVHRLRFVQFIQQRSQRRGFSASGRARNQHESGLFFRDRMKNGRKVELVDTGNVGRQFSQNDGVVAALREDVHAETRLRPK